MTGFKDILMGRVLRLLYFYRMESHCCPYATPVKGCQCCCLAHCEVTFHNIYGSKAFHQTLSNTAWFELIAQVAKDMKEQEHIMEEDTVGEHL